MVADNDMTSQQNVVGKYDVAADLAVMPDMRSHHKKTAVTHLGYPATVLGADAHRDIFADVTIGAHHESRRLPAGMARLPVRGPTEVWPVRFTCATRRQPSPSVTCGPTVQ